MRAARRRSVGGVADRRDANTRDDGYPFGGSAASGPRPCPLPQGAAAAAEGHPTSRLPPPAHLQESVATLRDAAMDVVLDVARLWREQKGNAWTSYKRVLASALDVLVRSETVLGEVLEGEPARH